MEYHNGINHLSQSVTLQTKDSVKPEIDVMILKEKRENAKMGSLFDAPKAKKKSMMVPTRGYLSPMEKEKLQEKTATKKKAKKSWRTMRKFVYRPNGKKSVIATGSFVMDTASGSTHVNLKPSVGTLLLHAAAAALIACVLN